MNNPQPTCRTCVTPIGRIESPTATWWAHETHPADDHDAVPAAWVDGDPLMEAIASTLWEHCPTEGTSLVVDDPRNIAATAAAVARAVSSAGLVAVPPTGQTALRDRIELAIHSELTEYRLGPDTGMIVQRLTDAALGALPTSSDRAALERVRAVLETEAVVGRSALEFRGLIALALMADEAQQQPDTVRPRCPHCQLPHDLTPGSMAARACEMVRADIAEAERRHTEGDHSRCAVVDCEVVRARRAAAASAGVQTDEEASRG
ncbi:hypothetical protein [Streptomyces sp. NBC_01373]|uniref:hypothetical protein n=1 Tax=Streptomyces sp. NBC_01373 TaxID=2903843 RepID=UPI00224D6F43|nr:hypothetical protein [Streptomyces sp. NBC_01373]MCX4703902.1 hypothetical protein [Streptomyces sp. NBC_01373]